MATRSRGRLRWIGDEPKCAICAGNGAGGCAEHHLTHGVSVWLCETHRSDAFLRRDGGHDFVDSLRGMWTAAGRLGTRQRAALATHIRNVRSAPDQRAQPGSYSWPRLREEAERRFAGGEPPKDVFANFAHVTMPMRPMHHPFVRCGGGSMRPAGSPRTSHQADRPSAGPDDRRNAAAINTGPTRSPPGAGGTDGREPGRRDSRSPVARGCPTGPQSQASSP